MSAEKTICAIIQNNAARTLNIKPIIASTFPPISGFFDFTRQIMLKINAGGKNKINVNRVVFTAEITAKIIPRRDHTLHRLSEIPSIIFSFLSSSMINIDKYII